MCGGREGEGAVNEDKKRGGFVIEESVVRLIEDGVFVVESEAETEEGGVGLGRGGEEDVEESGLLVRAAVSYFFEVFYFSFFLLVLELLGNPGSDSVIWWGGIEIAPCTYMHDADTMPWTVMT